jgi:hypothetical protein
LRTSRFGGRRPRTRSAQVRRSVPRHKGSLGVRAAVSGRTSRPGAYHNAGGLAFWFPRAGQTSGTSRGSYFEFRNSSSARLAAPSRSRSIDQCRDFNRLPGDDDSVPRASAPPQFDAARCIDCSILRVVDVDVVRPPLLVRDRSRIGGSNSGISGAALRPPTRLRAWLIFQVQSRKRCAGPRTLNLHFDAIRQLAQESRDSPRHLGRSRSARLR